MRSVVAAALGVLAGFPGLASAAEVLAGGSTLREVVVYSQQARVRRRASVVLDRQARRLVLADLPDSVLPDSVQVACRSAQISDVTVARERGRLVRQQEALTLADALDSVTDRLGLLDDEEGILQRELELIRGLELAPPDAEKTGQRVLGLFAGAWAQILSWTSQRVGEIERRLEQLRRGRRELEKERQALTVEAGKLDLGSVDQPVQRVYARLRGPAGRHEVQISYAVPRSTWRPAYDLRYDHAARRVDLVYYAVVRQTSGEDWRQAKLRFSTARPTGRIRLPELPTWTLGRRRDFRPEPTPYPEPPIRPWVPVAPSTRPRERFDAVERLKAALAGETAKAKRDRRREAKPVHRPSDAIHAARLKSYDFEDDRLEGELASPSGQAVEAARPSVPPPAPAMGRARPAPAKQIAAAPSAQEPSSAHSPRERAATDQVYSIAPPPPGSPAALAAGYVFSLQAPGRHDVSASGDQRRIPLLRRRLRGELVHRIVPGRSEAAYLMAELNNGTGRPILAGNANLFTDGLFTGRSWLATALPGRALRLPLGVDDSVGVVRHLSQNTTTQGVFIKDDATVYRVTVEIANHHRYPITVDLREQVPLQRGEKVSVDKLTFYEGGTVATASAPRRQRQRGWSKPDEQGRVRWGGRVAAGQLKKLSFSYRIVRPKDWLLQQRGG